MQHFHFQNPNPLSLYSELNPGDAQKTFLVLESEVGSTKCKESVQPLC